MNNLALATLSLLMCSAALAEEATQCADYTAREGIEIRFSTDDLYRRYGFQMFHSTPEVFTSTPYDTLAGKKGKIIGAVTGKIGVMKYHEVLMEDCTRVYWYDTDGNLEPSDAHFGAVVFLQEPRSSWEVSEKVDPLTDAKSCYITPKSRTPFPMFFYHSTQGFSAGVVGGDFPGKPTTFRVDKNRAIAEIEGLTGSRAQTLVSQIRAGGMKLLVASYTWPNDYKVIREFNLEGLTPHLDYCRDAVRR